MPDTPSNNSTALTITPPKMSKKPYEAETARLQAELLKVQHWAQETGQKFVLLFEGRDAAGKGGTISSLPSISTPTPPVLLPSTSPPIPRAASDFSSTISSIFPPRVR